jgi:chaperonin GroES
MKIEPEGTMVFIKPDPPKEKTEGGIILPPVAKDRQEREGNTGVIMSIGPAAAIEFAGGEGVVGDHILFAKYAGYIVEDDEDLYRVINHKDVLGKVV